MDKEKDLDFINQLPDELLENIFELLSPEDIVHIGSVSKRFKVLSQDERLWRTHILQFRDYRDEAEYSMKEAEFIKIMSFAPCFQKIDMEVKDVKELSLVRLPSLFQCFDVEYLEEIHVKYVDRRSLDEILKLPKLKKLYIVQFLEDCSGHPGRRLSEGPSCLETLLVKLADHEILCNMIESHCNSLMDVQIFVNPEEGPNYFMNKIVMCPNLKTLAISCVQNVSLLENITGLRKLALWPDPNVPFHSEYLPYIPVYVEDLILSSWAAEDIEEELEAIIQCCRHIYRLRELKIYMNYHIEERCDEQLAALRSALPDLTITCLHNEELLFNYT